MMENKTKEYFDHDGFWKDLIDCFFYYLLKRALPELYERTDTKKDKRFLDKEFRDILNTGDSEIHRSPHFADFVLEVPLKYNDAAWVLLHIETQGPGGGGLAERMNHYRSLIYAHYRKEPVALAIVTGGHKKEERLYSYSHFGTRVIYKYNNLVLAELNDEELQASDNPIDLAIYAAKCALLAKEEKQKYRYLRTLLDLLVKRGWSREDNRNLLLFLERIIDLRDKDLKKQYTEYRDSIKKEGKNMMRLLMGEEEELLKKIEKRALLESMAEGMAEGMTAGKMEVARKLLARGDYSPEIVSEIAGLPLERIRSLDI